MNTTPKLQDNSACKGYDWDGICAANPIVDTIGATVNLKQKGSEYVGLCPFHPEKTPSFHVVPQKGFYNCFGCGAHGDVIDFVAANSGISTRDAIQSLTGGTSTKLTVVQSIDRANALAERDKQKELGFKKATAQAAKRWDQATPANENNGYLTRKKIDAFGVMQQSDGKLLLPVYDAAGNIQSVQSIADDGGKLFHVGAKTKGGRFNIGIHFGRTIICEGFATGASIYDAVSEQVCVAYSKNNMAVIARELAGKGVNIVLAADTNAADDMQALGAELSCPVAVPTFGSDFNDMAIELGLDCVAALIKNAQTPLPAIAPPSAPAIEHEGPAPLFRQLSAAPEYPVDALGPILAPAAKAIASQSQCAIACAANSVLAVASLAAQGRANAILPIGNGKPTPLSLFILTVLESGERKSTADSYALKPVRDYERRLSELENNERRECENAIAAYEAASKTATIAAKGDRVKLEKALNDLGPKPLLPMLSIIAPSGDQTFEGLFKVFERGRPSLAMLCDDGATFLGGHSLRAETRASTTGNLCRAWDGSRLERIRGGDGAIVLYDRRLAVHIMVQPGVAGEFLSDAQFADQGLLARFLLSAPASLAGSAVRLRNESADVERNAAAKAASELEAYNGAISVLLRGKIRWKDKFDRATGVFMNELPLSDEARELYLQTHNTVMQAVGQGQPFETIKPFASKLCEQAVRIAGILTLISNADALEIPAAIMADAVALAQYYADEAVRLTDAAATDSSLKKTDQLRCWLLAQNCDLIGLQTIYQSCQPKSLRTAKATRDAMAVLVSHGWAIPLPDGASIEGKHCKEVWRLVRQ